MQDELLPIMLLRTYQKGNIIRFGQKRACCLPTTRGWSTKTRYLGEWDEGDLPTYRSDD